MVLAEIELSIFLMIIGLGALYMAFRRGAVMWAVMSTVFFASNVVYGASIPFKMAADGTVIGTSANIILIGISLIFTLLSLIKSIHLSFEGLKT